MSTSNAVQVKPLEDQAFPTRDKDRSARAPLWAAAFLLGSSVSQATSIAAAAAEAPPASQGGRRTSTPDAKARAAVLRAIEMGDLAGAHRIAADAGDHVAERVLAPPRATSRPASGAPDRELDFHWLRDHAGEYAGQWVALRGGHLLGAAATLVELQKRLVGEPHAERALIMRVRS